MKPLPITTAERAIEIACAHLRKTKSRYAKCEGAHRVTFDGKDIWFVSFDTVKPPGVLWQSPDSITVFVDPQTGEAETQRAL